MLDLDAPAGTYFDEEDEVDYDDCDMTPLMLCACNGMTESAKLLLDLGAKPDFKTKDKGLSAMDFAKSKRFIEVGF